MRLEINEQEQARIAHALRSIARTRLVQAVEAAQDGHVGSAQVLVEDGGHFYELSEKVCLAQDESRHRNEPIHS
jgi:hypothetical protein